MYIQYNYIKKKDHLCWSKMGDHRRFCWENTMAPYLVPVLERVGFGTLVYV